MKFSIFCPNTKLTKKSKINPNTIYLTKILTLKFLTLKIYLTKFFNPNTKLTNKIPNTKF